MSGSFFYNREHGISVNVIQKNLRNNLANKGLLNFSNLKTPIILKYNATKLQYTCQFVSVISHGKSYWKIGTFWYIYTIELDLKGENIV